MEKEKSPITVEPFNWDQHRMVYDKWFLLRKATRPMDEIVSPHGIVICWNGHPVCIGFLCKTDSRVALLTNFISDPVADDDIRSECLDTLIGELSDHANHGGFLILGTSSSVPALINRFEKLGFNRSHENVTNFWRSYGLDSISSGGR